MTPFFTMFAAMKQVNIVYDLGAMSIKLSDDILYLKQVVDS